ncbi:Tex-like N-terminal domain-containing protein, partial [Paenibacillus sonchi]
MTVDTNQAGPAAEEALARQEQETITQAIAKELGISVKQVRTTVGLLDEGNTIPFIARYRKEMTGELDENVLRDIEERLSYLRNLGDRKKDVLRSIEEQGKLTKELQEQILKA